MDNVKIICRGMLYVAVSGKTAGKGYTEQEALINLKKNWKKKSQRNQKIKSNRIETGQPQG